MLGESQVSQLVNSRDGPVRYPHRTAIVAVSAVVLLSGCFIGHTGHTFRLELTVLNADDGEPIKGVDVVLDASPLAEDRKEDIKEGHHARVPNYDARTDKEGRFTSKVYISPYPSRSGKWYLKLQKEGFEPLIVDIRPAVEPSDNEETPMPVKVVMKPLPKQP
jgi:hypothetical protein